MTNALSPQTRAAIINYDPIQPHALTTTEFCRSVKISRSVFSKIRSRAASESTAALHPRSRAPKHPSRRYGPDFVNELATIARLLASVGQVDAAPRERPKFSDIPFVRATAMSLWQLDAFECRLTHGQTITIYQLIDNATSYDVGTWAYARHENSADAKQVLERAIDQHGSPCEVLSDNSLAFNQLRQGTIGPVELFLASRGTMPISGLPGKPTTQCKNERSHQTLIRFLDANQPTSLEQVQARINSFREHYNKRRPHQTLGQATPAAAWELLEHTPALEPIPLVALEAKASQYRQPRTMKANELERSDLTISKTGAVSIDDRVERAK